MSFQYIDISASAGSASRVSSSPTHLAPGEAAVPSLWPSGAYAVFEAGWRGAAYGAVDALLLTAFPAAVAFSLLSGRVAGLGRRLLFAAFMLPMVLMATGAYHLGYEQFREDGIAAPETGNTIISVPALFTGNPLGSVLTHAAMHVTADLHAYETDVFLPPQTDAP